MESTQNDPTENFIRVSRKPVQYKEDKPVKPAENEKPAEKEKPAKKENKPGEKGANSYEGCLYTLGFKVDREVALRGLEFFGPADKDVDFYDIRVIICRTEEFWSTWRRILGFRGGEPNYNIVEMLPIWTKRVYDVKKGENFGVVLPGPINISPNVWTDVKFEISGPETECLQFGFGGTDLHLDKSNVKVDFLAGSRQLPALYFTAVE